MPRTQSGFALVLVLWALVLLTTIGVSFGFAVRVETGSGTALADQVRAEAIATAGVRRAILGLIAEDISMRWLTDGREYEIAWQDATLRVTLKAESGKIDLNAASPDLLAGLFGNLFPEADAQSLTDAVQDWRDRDDRLSEYGAESAEYAAAGRWGPANARFTSVAELSQVMGFSGMMVEKASPYLTIFAKQQRVNVIAASVEVLAAIPDVTRAMAEQFVAQRDADLAAGQTPDVRALEASRRFVDTRPTAHVVEIRANAALSGGASATVEAVVNTRAGDQAYETLNWRTPMSPPVADEEA